VILCDQDWNHTHRHPRDDDDDQHKEHKRSAPRGILGRMANWVDSRGHSRVQQGDRDRGSGWYRGETSRERHKQQQGDFFPSAWSVASPEEKRAMRMLWQAKGEALDKNKAQYGLMWQLENFSDERDG
jgi:hypothetical protein